MLAPPDRHVPRDRRPAAAALVVVDQLAAVGQRVEAGQEIVVMRAGPAVQHHDGRPAPDPAHEELDAAHLRDDRLVIR